MNFPSQAYWNRNLAYAIVIVMQTVSRGLDVAKHVDRRHRLYHTGIIPDNIAR
jgi:hypothetical protein